MKKIIFNEGQLNRFTKKQIIELFLSQQEQLQKQTTQLEELNRKFDLIYEQLTMSRTDRFAQKTEKFDYDQLTLCFNEAEVTIETDCAEEPLIEEVIPAYKRKKRPKGKRDEDLSGLLVRKEYHELSEKQLFELFPNGYRSERNEVMNVPVDFPFVEVVVRECVVDRRHYSPVFCKGEMHENSCLYVFCIEHVSG